MQGNTCHTLLHSFVSQLVMSTHLNHELQRNTNQNHLLRRKQDFTTDPAIWQALLKTLLAQPSKLLPEDDSLRSIKAIMIWGRYIDSLHVQLVA